MDDHPHQLYAVSFTEADQVRLAGFSCGKEPWSKHVGEWICGSDVLDSMSKYKTQVWLFETVTGEVVGFASLGTSNWKWPLPHGGSSTIILIPMLGIDYRHQGQPPDPDWRYSHQILSHLLAESHKIHREWAGNPAPPQWLLLMVHRDNSRAIRFYQRCGFELVPDVVRRNDHLVMQIWIGDEP